MSRSESDLHKALGKPVGLPTPWSKMKLAGSTLSDASRKARAVTEGRTTFTREEMQKALADLVRQSGG